MSVALYCVKARPGARGTFAREVKMAMIHNT